MCFYCCLFAAVLTIIIAIMDKSKKLTPSQCAFFHRKAYGTFIHKVRVFREMSPKDVVREILFDCIYHPDLNVSPPKEKFMDLLFEIYDLSEPLLTRWFIKSVEGGELDSFAMEYIAHFISRCEP